MFKVHHFHPHLFCVALAGILPAAHCNAEKVEQAIEVTTTGHALVAQGSARTVKVSYTPQGDYLGYWNETLRFKEACRSSGGKALDYPIYKMAERISGLFKFPYTGVDLNHPNMPLPEGTWRCQIKMSMGLATGPTSGELAVLTSNEVVIEVLPPSPEDIVVLKEAGLWDIYNANNNSRDTMDYHEEIAEKHPASGYYCHLWAGKLHYTYERALTPEALSSDQSQYDIVWGPSKGALEHMKILDNLERHPCEEASPLDLAYWHAIFFLNLGDFASAQSAARQGIKMHPDAGRKAYFEKLLSFKSEEDYLKQYKSYRRVSESKN